MKKQLDNKYNHQLVEQGKADFWQTSGLFRGDLTSNKPVFSMVIAPPNVTGKLHLGHAWDTSLSDLLVRYKKLNGFNVLWVPGMDHAGIATQAKVEQRLREEENKLRYDLGREAFIQRVWEWKEEYSSTIRSQWNKMGLGLDYSHEQFTLNDHLSAAVRKVFVDLYNKGLIYRGQRIISWDPVQCTALSNIEVIYKEVKGHMYHLRYWLADRSQYLIVATTRPETMFADQCLVVNSQDPRYQQFIGQQVINPANNQLIPIIADDYVEVDFGTGVMKCTPAHDPNDFIIGQRHHLAMPICMNENGTMNTLAGKYANQDRFVCRQNLLADLTAADLVEKVEDHVHQVGHSERSGAVVEPYLSAQWFVKMQPLAEQVLQYQASSEAVEFFPLRFNQTLVTWMENIQDWCISRQLWWGHQIPAWYHKETKEVYVGINPPSDSAMWVQDEDVLDTWFSSALWPFTALGWGYDEALLNKFFPTDVLVTGYDIIFFWVSRMMFQSLEFLKTKPFKNVLIHGLIRDEQGRKMSKSLGNGVDPMDVIDEYGADALRFFLLTNSAPGQDLRYSLEKLKAAWNFINKLWNASRFVMMSLPEEFTPVDDFHTWFNARMQDQVSDIDQWILQELAILIKEIQPNLEHFEFMLAGKAVYNFVWNKFCSWYLEFAKVNLNGENSAICETTQQTLFYVLKQILIILHPYIPFVTEEIYQQLGLQSSILMEQWPEFTTACQAGYINEVIELVGALREVRLTYNVPKTKTLEFDVVLKANTILWTKDTIKAINGYLQKMVNAKINHLSTTGNQDPTAVISVLVNDYTIELISGDLVDLNEEIAKIREQLVTLDKELQRSASMLTNEKFVNNAKPEKLMAERAKQQQYQEQHSLLTEKLNQMLKKTGGTEN